MPEWPHGWERTARPKRSQFSDKSLSRCTSALLDEVRKMRGTDLRIDHDLETYERGGVQRPYANQPLPDDRGVVVYFTLPGGKQVCWPCDRWDRPEHNLWAIVKSLEAKRGLERWGAVSMDREYQGYLRLPDAADSAQEDAWASLGLTSDATEREIKAAWRSWAKEHHPDRGGEYHRFASMSAAVHAILVDCARNRPDSDKETKQ